MEICYSTGSIMFPLNVLAFASLFLCLFKLIMVLRRSLLRQPLQKLKTRKKRAARKKNKAEINPNKDVPVADNSRSHPKDSDVEPPKDSAVETLSQPKDLSVEGLRQFTYQSLINATYNFVSNVRMSGDGLRNVYRGDMFHTNESFAIRRLGNVPSLSDGEFLKELSLLSQLNHPNIAKLIGYSQQGQRALVYEYLRGGSLENYLRGNKKCLDWQRRKTIVLGVARAIEYLQKVMNPPILHVYINPSNIWLDEEFTPKLSAAGVLRMFPTPSGIRYPIEICGSYAYGLHDYVLTNTVTVAADIYGFGILLLEVITAKKEISYAEDGEMQTLIDWGQPYVKDGHLTEMVDPMLKGKIDENELSEVVAIARACLEKQPGSRPDIGDVVRCLDNLVNNDRPHYAYPSLGGFRFNC